MEAWHRYQLPLAITESHLGCSREEQIRWFAESWESAENARRDGADVRAVTAWSLLGAYNWNTLVTHDADYYEPGVFDIRGGEPRPTALAGVLRSFGAGKKPDHPALGGPGWWHRPERLFRDRRPDHMAAVRIRQKSGKGCLLVLGANGTLGRAFVGACDVRGLRHRSFTRLDLDLSDAVAVERQVREIQPWAVINATGYGCVDEAEVDPMGCFAVNTEGAARLAITCRRAGCSLLCFSSDLVFDGRRRCCYVESDSCSPLNIYGHSKAAMEKRVLMAMPDALVIRTSSFFGPSDDLNVLTRALRELARGQHVWLADDTVFSPTYVPDLVSAAFDLLIDGVVGIWHLANAGETTWAELARLVAKKRCIDTRRLRACSQRELNQRAIRPIYSVLGTAKGQILPVYEHAMVRYAAALRI
jgi:dTDP-4-dehydrorhamnose reductase